MSHFPECDVIRGGRGCSEILNFVQCSNREERHETYQKDSYFPSHSRAVTYEAKALRYSNGESGSHYYLVV